MTLGWVYRSVPHLGDSYNLDLLKCISAFWGKYMYNYNKYYAHSSKKGEQVAALDL